MQRNNNKNNTKKAKPKHLEKPDPIQAEAFKKYCLSLSMDLQEEESQKLRHYLDTLMLWNTRINLVGTLAWKETLAELVIDSYYLADFIQKLKSEGHINDLQNTWDLGSGAGLPGIPLRIFWNEGTYTLVESREKRALFMTNFLLKEPLSSTKVFWGRAEKFFSQQKEKEIQADIILSRAFMPYEELMEFVYPHLKKGGLLLLLLNEKVSPSSLWELSKSTSYHPKDIFGKDSLQKRYFHALKKK